MNYAGFGKRLLAYLIDGVIIGLAGGILAVFFGYYFYLIFGWLLGALYFILMEGGTWQATLGKRAMGLIVTDMNGDPISYGTATLRYLGKFVSSLILGIGYLMAAFTENHQALHDKIASTLVLCAAPAGNTRYSSQGAGSPAPPSMASPGTGRCDCRDQRRVCRQIGAAAAGGNHDRQGQRSVSDCTVGISTGNIQASLPGEL